MLTNYHTHTNFCDGKDSPEEMVISAINNNMDSIGFSGHGQSGFDYSCCIKDMDKYKKEIKRLKEKYKNDIEIYLGIEEEMFGPVNRCEFDYIIGSAHYVKKNNKHFDIDLKYEKLAESLNYFNNDVLEYATNYYENFCHYLKERKPDIVGHFDLITKFDEKYPPIFLNNKEYHKIAEKFLRMALEEDLIFEVNTGAIARGYRTTPYPYINLLHIIKKEGGKIILSSDCHDKDYLTFNFKETKKMLKDIGFTHTYHLYKNEFIKKEI